MKIGTRLKVISDKYEYTGLIKGSIVTVTKVITSETINVSGNNFLWSYPDKELFILVDKYKVTKAY